MVVPSWASSSMTFRTSPMSSGPARGRLVEEEHLRLHAQGPGDGHALLLAAGQAGRVFVLLVAQPDLLEVLVGGRDRLGLAARPGPRSAPRCSFRGPSCAGRGELLEEHLGAAGSVGSAPGVPATRACEGSASTRTPSISTDPTVGSSRKFRQRRSVVFPLPDRPMIITASRRVDVQVDSRAGRGCRRSTSRGRAPGR